MPTPITIECFTDGTTSITHGIFLTRAPFTEAFIQTQAKAILKDAHYNECFSVQIKQNSESARAQNEADKLTAALKAEIDKVPHLNLAIEGQEPPDWAKRKIETDAKQMAILREATIVAARIRSYPKSAGTPDDLKHLSDRASPEALLAAKDFIITKKRPKGAPNTPTEEGDVHAAAYLTALFLTCVVLGIILSPLWLIGAGLFVLAGAGVLAVTIYTKREDKRFNSETGCSDMIEKMQKISPDFLNSMQPGVPQTNPSPSLSQSTDNSSASMTASASSQPSQETSTPSKVAPSSK